MLFDFGGTLDAPGVHWLTRFHRLYLQIGLEVAPERIKEAFYWADAQLLAHPEITTLPLLPLMLEHAALQCGICTPGFLIAAKALLERNPEPTETEVRYWLAGNLCRCTGYDKIVRAVLDAAAEMRGA